MPLIFVDLQFGVFCCHSFIWTVVSLPSLKYFQGYLFTFCRIGFLITSQYSGMGP